MSADVHGSLDWLELRRAGVDAAQVVDFSVNVNPFGPSPKVREAILAVDISAYPDRRALLLSNLRGFPRPWRAHFHCTVAIADATGRLAYAEGDCPGEIIDTERGTNGFGYDPIFLLTERQLTMAELSSEEKNQISHRALAVRAALPILRAYLDKA